MRSDFFEQVGGRSASALAALDQAPAIPAQLLSSYHRDLQLLKALLFRATDQAHVTCALLAETLPRVRFVPDRITLSLDFLAAEGAHKLVLEEGIPFREAYRRVAERLRR